MPRLLLAKMHVREFRPEPDRERFWICTALCCAAPGDRRGLATGRGPSGDLAIRVWSVWESKRGFETRTAARRTSSFPEMEMLIPLSGGQPLKSGTEEIRFRRLPDSRSPRALIAGRGTKRLRKTSVSHQASNPQAPNTNGITYRNWTAKCLSRAAGRFAGYGWNEAVTRGSSTRQLSVLQ